MTRTLAWTLIHFLWEGASIALLLACALLALRTSSARVRYAAACLAMLAMVVAFGGTLAHLWPEATTAVRDSSARLRWPATPPAGFPPAAISGNKEDARLSSLVLFWMAGVCIFSIHSVVSWAAAWRLRRKGVCLAPAPWQRTMRRLASDIGLAGPLSLLESALAEVPMVMGFLRPVILLPAGMLANFPADQLEYFLLHELAHVRRYDYLVNLLQSLAEDLLFYHPAVWWVSRVIREEREHCCDDIVLGHGDAREYATALVALEQKRGMRNVAVLAANGGQLMHRIQRLLGYHRRSPITAGGLIGGCLLVATAALAVPAFKTPPRAAPATRDAAALSPLPVMTSVPRRPSVVLLAQAEEARAGRVEAPADPFRKWLDEDVVYLVTPAERDAFLRLNTDMEREMFVEQFWLRRDPTPGTVENEMKEEHYRRIATADARFSSSIAGWRTDRGRIYITFGPPDEIDSHPNGAGETATLPFEDWRYRFIEGIGNDVNIEFVDATRTGEYRMTMDPSEKDAVKIPR